MKPKVTPKPRLSEGIENQNPSLQDLIAKAKNKVQEKRQIDQREAEIKSLRLAARLAINQMVATVVFENHLSYHTELEQLGCSFIHDQVTLLSRSDYKHRRSTKHKSMLEYCSQDSQITKNHVEFGSAESTNQKTNQV